MRFPPSFTGFWPLLFLSCVCCGKDPELIEKRDRLQAEIVRLQEEVALAEAKLKDMPEDESKELEAAEEQLDAIASKAVQLEYEVDELRRRKADLEKEYAEYQEKYPIN